MKVGKVLQVVGPVVDVKFETDELPEIYNALHLSGTTEGGTEIGGECLRVQVEARNALRVIHETEETPLIEGGIEMGEVTLA